MKHWAIFTDNNSQKDGFIKALLTKKATAPFSGYNKLNGVLFSKKVLERLIDEEDRHDTKIINLDRAQSVKSMSSGEQKKALLHHLLKQEPDFIILVNPFDNLDVASQADLRQRLKELQTKISFIELISRKQDVLSFATEKVQLIGHEIVAFEKIDPLEDSTDISELKGGIPKAPSSMEYSGDVLIRLKNISVKYLDKPILNNINWTIQKGDFWELRGKNGSGKTTILSMITGENPKGYGQELYIFGNKKGSGESVWELKKSIGYFTPSITDKFTGYHSVEHMIISGLTDSIGLYVRPSEIQKRLAKEWLQLIDMWNYKDKLYHSLTMGQKRLVMCARAMVKHPPLLILDEPTAGLDDNSAALFVSLVNKFSKASNTTIIFVSHRREPGLKPNKIFQLEMTDKGSLGKILN